MQIFSHVCVPSTSTNALCSYPHVNVSIRDLSQILTTAPIFLYSNYFRQKYLEIASCAVSLLNNIWVRVEHSLLKQANLKRKSTASQAVYRHDVNKIVGTSWTLDSESTPNIRQVPRPTSYGKWDGGPMSLKAGNFPFRACTAQNWLRMGKYGTYLEFCRSLEAPKHCQTFDSFTQFWTRAHLR